MILRIDHVSLAVKDYDGAVEFFTKILGATSQYNGTDNNMKYYWETFALGDLSRFEIIKPTAEGSFLENFLKNREGGIHHLVLQTPDIEMTKDILEKNNIPYFGYQNYGERWKELFIHPKDAFGVLLQIGQFKATDWLSPSYSLPESKKWLVDKDSDKINLTIAHPGGGKVKVGLEKEEVKKLIRELKNIIE
ncbi:MAG: VOC family protein [Candidatus Lokiarchaeota archaeon]|nr:VOC family protein [Candidatus Lokiarchaeota archaeon]